MNIAEYLKAEIGRQADLARLLGVTPAFVNQMVTTYKPVPIRHCVKIYKFSEGQVSLQSLRPHDWHLIWPELRDDANQTDEASH